MLAVPVHAEVVGHSVQHRPIRLVRIGAPDAPRRVLVVGCIHGTERAGLAIARALRSAAPAAGTQVLVLDTINPDGCAHHSRANARGVDLNRNFPWGWQRQEGVFASGPEPASEPETRVAMRLIATERPGVTIWFHQHMDLVDRTRGSDPTIVRRYARSAHMRVRRLAPLPGTATRWQNHHLPSTTAFVVELPAGRLTATAVRRHVRAVSAVARIARPSPLNTRSSSLPFGRSRA
jgi:predicted deacylase